MTVAFVLQAATSLRASQACFNKVLLILGIRQSKWAQLHRPLVHTDLEVLELLPVVVSNGEVVREQYSAVAEKSGVPQVILSDQGSDLQRGLKLLKNKHPNVIGLNDVAHAVALLLKATLESNDAWKAFKAHCGTVKAAIQQTLLAHLVPPKFKTKARYMNVSEQIRWGQNVCLLLERHRLGTLSPTQQAEMPAELLEEKLGWVTRFADSLAGWAELIELSEQTCRLVRSLGYAPGVAEQVDAALPKASTESGGKLRSQLIAFVRSECAKLPLEFASPGSSEVIESLIGKGKRLEGQQSQSGFTRYVLGLAASVTTPTASLLESVSQTVGIKHLTQWITEHLHKSVQSKRRRDLPQIKEQKQDKQARLGRTTF